MQVQKKRKRKEDSDLDEMIQYTRKIKKYRPLSKHLKTLNGLIGMKELKRSVAIQLQFILTTGGKMDSHFLNTSLVGPPGTGKTTVAEILHKIWMSLGLFHDDMPFTILNRGDFVGSYMGHTANKTRKTLNKYAGSVIFIDEAYSLMNGEKDDAYGKECLDQLCAFMGEEKAKTIVIIAGYENEINSNFFGANAGLKRRFGWHFKIAPYTASELFQIFECQLKSCGWHVHKKAEELFHQYFKKFKNAGGDTENLSFQAKLQYAKDNWTNKKQSKQLTFEHVKKAMKEYFVEEETTEYNMYI